MTTIIVRAHTEIARRRAEKQGEDLLEQLMWRIKILGGEVDLTVPANREAFSDVLDAFVPENHELVLNPSERCRATRDRGGEITFTGFLATAGNVTATLDRRLYLGRRFADHRGFRVVPRFRGNRIAPRSFIRSVRLYDTLGFEHVRIRAIWSGTWYWALWGFHFQNLGDQANVQEHAQRIIDVCGGGLDASILTHPIQFARLGEPQTITFDELCDLLPHCRDAYEDVAVDNGIGLHDPVPFGRAVLLTAPSWWGILDLTGPDRLIFDDRARRLIRVEGAS